MKLAELFVEITGKDGGLTKTLAGARAGLMGLVGVGAKAAGGIAGAFGGLGGVLAGAGLGVGLAHVFQQASELNATLSKTKVIFGDAAKSIIDQSDELAKKFGVSKSEYINAATSFGAVFKGMGKSQAEAAALGNQLARLGMDLKSFEGAGVTTAQAFDAISGALRGEFDPMEKFRVFLSADKIEAKALAMGLAQTKGEISDAAKKTATMALILEQTKDAQGDMVRTAAESDNQYAKMVGTFDNLTTTVGQMLMPAFSDLLTAVNDALTGVTSRVGQTQGMFSSFTSFVHEAVSTIGLVFRNWGDIVELVGIGLAEFWTHTTERVQYGQEVIGAFVNWFASNFTSIITDTLNATLTLWSNWEKNVSGLIAAVVSYVKSGFSKPFKFEMTPLLDGFEAKTDAFELPEQKGLTDFEGQRQEVLNRITDREAKRLEEQQKAKGGAGVAKAETPNQDKTPAKQEKAKTSDLSGFVKELQSGVFDKDNGKKQVDLLTKIDNKLGQQLNRQQHKDSTPQPGFAI